MCALGGVPEKICCRYNPGGIFTLGETREGFQVMDNPGFGLGFERLILFVTGMQNIRDVIPFPRTPKNAEF